MAKNPPATTADADAVVAGVLVDPPKEHPGLRAMIQVMALEAGQRDDSGEDFVLDLMEQILQAETFDEIFAAQDAGAMSGKDFAARPFFLRTENITYMKSTQTENGGMPFYALLKVTEIATGEEVTVNCGGKTFLAVLHALAQKNYFDASEENPLGRAVVIIATPSPAGAYLSLKPYRVASAGVKK